MPRRKRKEEKSMIMNYLTVFICLFLVIVGGLFLAASVPYYVMTFANNPDLLVMPKVFIGVTWAIIDLAIISLWVSWLRSLIVELDYIAVVKRNIKKNKGGKA